jgi:hypothetical protein
MSHRSYISYRSYPLTPRSIDRGKWGRYTNRDMLSIGIAFLALSCLVSVTNIVNYALSIVKKRRGEVYRKGSAIHVLSIVFSIMAYVFAGDTLGVWVFIPAILDPATLFILAAPILLIRMIREAERSRDRS